MWHDVHFLAGGPPSTSTTSILYALVYVGVPAAFAFAGLVWTSRRPKDKEALPLPPSATPLNSNDVDEQEDALRRRVAVLERFLFLRHYDPNKIKRGTEKDTDVKFD